MARSFPGTPGPVINVQGAQVSLDNLNPFTWTAWAFKVATTTEGRIATKGDGASFKNFGEDNLVVSGTLRFRVGRATTSSAAWSVAGALPNGGLRFVAATYSSANGPKIYTATVTGQVAEVAYLAGYPVIGAGAETDDSAAEFCIGARNTLGGNPFNGSIADVRVYAAELSLAELQEVKSFGFPRMSALRGGWELIGDLSPEPDWSGAGNHGTVNGATKAAHPPGYSMEWITSSMVQAATAPSTPTTQDRDIFGTARIFRPTTTTRFYITNQPVGEPALYDAAHGAWDVFGGTIPVNDLKRYPTGNVSRRNQQVITTEADRDVQLARWISDPIKAYEFTANDSVAWVLGVGSQSGLNGVYHVHMWVYQGNTNTERGTLLSDFIGATGWPTTDTGRGEGQLALSPVSAQIGDRIGIEIGYRATATSGTRTGSLNFGGVSSQQEIIVIDVPIPLDGTFGTDLTEGSTQVTTSNGWIEVITDQALFTITERTITGTAKIIAVGVQQAITGTASIKGTTSRAITGSAAIKKTTDKAITGTAFIEIQIQLGSKEIQGRARIKRTEDREIGGIANIITASQAARTITGRASIHKTVDRTIAGVSRILIQRTQTITGRAAIYKTTSRTIDGAAYISVTGVTIQSIAGTARINVAADRTITGRARIKAPPVTQKFKIRLWGGR